MSDSRETSAFLQERHPEYAARAADWDLYLRSYVGGRPYFGDGTLFSHRLEHRTDYARRLERSYYLNHCRSVVDKMTALLFAHGLDVRPAPPEYLVTDADRQGNDLVQVLRRAATLSSIFGHVFVLVDVPRHAGEPPQSRSEELLLGLRPYFTLIPPTEVLNWETDERGVLLWCLVRERRGAQRVEGGARISRVDSREDVYRLWTPETWHLYGKVRGDWALLEEGAHGLGVVPLVSAKHRNLEDGPCGESLLRDAALINREIYNLSSLLQEILYRQTFGQLVAQGSAEEYVGEEETLAKLGTSSIFLYPDGREAPRYISPSASNAEIVLAQIDRMVEEIYRVAGLHPPERPTLSGNPESGLARAFRFADTSGILRDKGEALADAFEKALWIASLWEGQEREYTIAFPKDLGPAVGAPNGS